MKSLLVEGWRGINHSYAMVNQYQLLELRKRDLVLFHLDVPFFRAHWNRERNAGGFTDAVEREIFEIPSLADHLTADVCYRKAFLIDSIHHAPKESMFSGHRNFRI